MERLVRLSQDKATLSDLKDFFKSKLEKKIIDNVLNGRSVEGYSEANEIIKSAIKDIDNLYVEQSKHQAEIE